jgi:signal transduction histidine kinase
MQRFIAIRQDAADTEPVTAAELAERLDKAIAETRSLISAFHPATMRELGFAGSLRAAIEPFPAARNVQLSVRTDIDDHALTESVVLPLAQELVVNAVKHADPTTINVLVDAEGDNLVLDISDDGVGIDAATAGRAVRAGHLGLAMVRQRVEPPVASSIWTLVWTAGPVSCVPPWALESQMAPRAKPARPLVGRMFYYALDVPALSC